MSLQERLYSWLRWSEKYTKTDMVYLASGGFLSLLSQVSALGGALLLAILVGHFVPKTTYGEYKYILSIVALLSSFSLNGIGSAVLQSAAQGYGDALEKGFWANLRWSFVIFIGGLVMALYYLHGGNLTLAGGVLIGATFGPFLASASLFGSFLAGKKDFYHQTIFSICDNLIPIGLMIVTVLLAPNALALVAVYFAANTLAALYFYRRTKILYAQSVQKTDDSMLRYSKHLSVMGILGGFATTLDQILAFHFVGAAQLAVYTFATALPDQAKTPLKTVDNMVQPKFVARTAEEIQAGMRNKFFWYGVTCVVITVVYILLAPYIFALFFPNYISSVFYSQVYIVALLANIFDPAYTYLSSRKKIKELYIVGVTQSVLTIVAMVVGILWWGLLGLVIAQVFSRIAGGLLNYYLYRIAIKSDIAHA